MRYTIKTKGIMCGHCEATVEGALLALAGVTDAEADHEMNVVEVECADEVGPEALRSAVTSSGDYQVLAIEAC